MGVFGRGCYLAESWNKLDCFIVLTGYCGLNIFQIWDHIWNFFLLQIAGLLWVLWWRCEPDCHQNCQGAETTPSHQQNTKYVWGLLCVLETTVMCRHENPRDAATWHPPHARQRPPSLLLCLLHLRDHGCSDVGGAAQAEVKSITRFVEVNDAVWAWSTRCYISEHYQRKLIHQPGFKEWVSVSS